MPSTSHYEILCDRIVEEFPRFKIRERDRSWLLPLFWILSKISSQDYSRYATTVFSTVYVGSKWGFMSDREKYVVLRHELIHIRQFHRFPFGRQLWLLNYLLMPFCYLLLLPFVWTMRAGFEREGYTQTLLACYELDGTISDTQMEHRARWMAMVFGGSAYAWMWTGNEAYAWAMKTMRQINAGEVSNSSDRVVLEDSDIVSRDL